MRRWRKIAVRMRPRTRRPPSTPPMMAPMGGLEGEAGCDSALLVGVAVLLSREADAVGVVKPERPSVGRLVP